MANIKAKTFPGSYPKELRDKLISLDTDGHTRVFRKTLEISDLKTSQSRLLLPRKMVLGSPLFRFLTVTQSASLHDTGLKMCCFDSSGREYNMLLRFLRCNNSYRMIGDWGCFLRLNHDKFSVGDDIEMWIFVIPKEGNREIGMVLLHHPKDGQERRHRAAEEEPPVTVYVNQDELDQLTPDERTALEMLVLMLQQNTDTSK